MQRSFRLLYTLLLLSLFNIFIQASAVAAASIALPVIHLDAANNNPGARGAQLGREVYRHFPNIEALYDRYLAKRFSQHSFDVIASTRLPIMLEALGSDYSKEMSGVANAWALDNVNQLGDGKLSLEEYQVMNLLSDLGVIPGGSGFAVMGKQSITGTPIVGRNLDWAQHTELRHLQAITVYQNGAQGFVNIGFAGLLAVMSGFNEEGLFIADMNAEPFFPVSAQ